MGHKRLLLTVLTAAALFGAAISGCNREREPRLASASQRRGASLGSQPRAELAQGVAVRPAEVLAASAHRGAPVRRRARQPQRRQEQQYSGRPRRADSYRERDYAARSPRAAYSSAPLPVVVRSGDLARYEPLPEPIPVSELYAARPQAYQTQSGPYYASAGAPPVYNQTSVPMQPSSQYAAVSEPYTLVPSQTRPGEFDKVYAGGDGRARPARAHPSPELTMARAQLQGSAPLSDRVALPSQAPVRVMDVPLPTPDSFPVPIPELEPIRYSRAPAPQQWQQPQQFQQPQNWQPAPVAYQPPQRPLPPLPSAYAWGPPQESVTAAPQSQPAPAPVRTAPAMTTAEPYQTVPALPVVTPAAQGWVASPTTAMRVFK